MFLQSSLMDSWQAGEEDKSEDIVTAGVVETKWRRRSRWKRGRRCSGERIAVCTIKMDALVC